MILVALTKGRIEKKFYKLLKEKNIINNELNNKRKLYIDIDNIYRLIVVKSDDVVNLVNNGYANIGIVGSDTITEYNYNNIKELLDLKTGVCNFSLASIPNISINNINVVATKYPNNTKRLLNSIGINPNIVTMSGSLELAPIINYADAIVDIVETGTTLRENGLINIMNLEKISTRVITNDDNVNKENVKKLIKKIK